MSGRLPPHYLHLVQDALLKSFHYKDDLKAFLRRCHVSENALAQMSDSERKRDWLNRLFPKLENTDRGQAFLQSLGKQVAEQDSFPGLENREDAAFRIEQAKSAVANLRKYFKKSEEDAAAEKERIATRQRAAELREQAVRSRGSLATLRSRLDTLSREIGTQQGGYDFQTWFYDLADFFEVDCRRPFSTNGRQIDGSITVDGTTYLVELKFTKNQAAATDIDSLLAKVNSKADNTMGIMVSMTGYSETAIDGASYPKTPLLLFDFRHLYNLILAEVESLPNVIRRVRRHSSQIGRAYLAVQDFGK